MGGGHGLYGVRQKLWWADHVRCICLSRGLVTNMLVSARAILGMTEVIIARSWARTELTYIHRLGCFLVLRSISASGTREQLRHSA